MTKGSVTCRSLCKERSVTPPSAFSNDQRLDQKRCANLGSEVST